jgi:hypothetical protein
MSEPTVNVKPPVAKVGLAVTYDEQKSCDRGSSANLNRRESTVP